MREQAVDETSLGYMLRLAGPMVITTISFTTMQFIDRIMVAHFSQGALAAILPASMIGFIPASFALGIMTTVNTFVSQSLGRGNLRDCSNYCWQAIYMGLAYSVVTFAVLWPCAPLVFKLMAQPTEIIGMEVTYLRIMLYGQFAVVFVWASSQFFMGVHRPIITMYAALAGQVVNVGANYILIFGKFGFPAMGIAGAGWGTFVGLFVGAVIRMYMFLKSDVSDTYKCRQTLYIDFRKIVDLLKVGSPAGFAFMINTAFLGTIMFSLIGRFGEDSLAATSAVYSCMGLSFMPVVGVATSLTAAVGKSIGKNKKDIAVKQTSVCLKISLAYMGLVGFCFFAFRHYIVLLWRLNPNAALIGANVLICAAIFQVFDAAVITYSGALRGAGDTLWLGFISTLGASCVLGIGGYTLVRVFPDLGALGPWIAYTLHIIVVGIAYRWRFKSNRWMRIDLFKRRPVGIPVEAEPLVE